MLESRPLPVPDTVPLFAPLRAGLITLLRSLQSTEWDLPTVAGAWRVRDVAAHLLDGELRTLAAHRDAHSLASGSEIRSYDDVVGLIQRLNAEGVAAGRHLSTRLLTDLLGVTGGWMHAFVESLDPEAPALFAVAWAGEAESTNRFDTAREYTERWHHEMQIRTALGDRGHPETLLAEGFAVPLLETAIRVLPHSYREVSAVEGASIGVSIVEPSWNRSYTLRRGADGWQLYEGAVATPSAMVAAGADAWWRLFFNALPPADASRSFVSTGPSSIVAPLWRARSVMV